MIDPNGPDNRPRTFGYDNTHILIAAIVILGVLGGIWYVYGAYVAPKSSITSSSNGPAQAGIAKTPLTSTSPVATAPSSTTPPSR
jgi:hypothetical protein